MKPYLFLHIPKTGGSSVEQCLPFGRCTIKDIFKDSKNNNDFNDYGYGAKRHHYTLEQYNRIGYTDLDKLYKFTFVRNPWDRVVSIFHDWKAQNCRKVNVFNTANGSKFVIREELKEDMFSQFVSKILMPALNPNIKKFSPKVKFSNESSNAGQFVWNNYAQPVENCPFYYTIANGHFTPQIKYTHDSSNNQIVDFIGRYETLQEDYDKLNKICDWNFKFMTLPHSNKSKRAQKDYRKYYDDGSGLAKHLVSEIYREDIEIYGYTF